MSLACLGAHRAPQLSQTALNSHALEQDHASIDATLRSYCERGVLLWNPYGRSITQSAVSDLTPLNAREAHRSAAEAAAHANAACIAYVAESDEVRSFASRAASKVLLDLSRLSMALFMALCTVAVMFLLLCLTLSAIPEASASTAGVGASLPYEVWLSALQKSATGPIAFTIALLGIIGCGATLIFTGGEISRFMRSIIYIVLVMTLLLGANSLMTNFFNGASINTLGAVAVSHRSGASANAAAATAAANGSAAAKGAASTGAAADADAGGIKTMEGKELKPSVFAKTKDNGGAYEPVDDYWADEQMLEDIQSLNEDLYAINPDLTYDEHMQRFISGLLGENETQAAERAAAAEARTKGHGSLKHPSVFEEPQAKDTRTFASDLQLMRTLTSAYDNFGLNSYQSAPLPRPNNELTLEALRSGNANLELQLFEFSTRTLKGFIPSHLDLSDSKLSWIALGAIALINLIFISGFIYEHISTAEDKAPGSAASDSGGSADRDTDANADADDGAVAGDSTLHSAVNEWLADGERLLNSCHSHGLSLYDLCQAL